MRFKNVLKKYNVTQIDLAERLQINRVSVSRLLSESNDLRLSTLHKIADAINCSVIELLLDGEDYEYRFDDASIILICPHCHKRIKLSVQSNE